MFEVQNAIDWHHSPITKALIEELEAFAGEAKESLSLLPLNADFERHAVACRERVRLIETFLQSYSLKALIQKIEQQEKEETNEK